MLPGGLLMGLLAPSVGKLFDKVGARPLLIPGGLLLSAVLFGYTRWMKTPRCCSLWACTCSCPLRLALIFTPAFTAGLNPLPHSLHSHGSAVLSTLQQLGGAAGTALLIGVMTAGTVSAAGAGKDAIAAQASGFSNGFMVAAFVSLGIVVIAAFMAPAKAAKAEAAHGEPVASQVHYFNGSNKRAWPPSPSLQGRSQRVFLSTGVVGRTAADFQPRAHTCGQ